MEFDFHGILLRPEASFSKKTSRKFATGMLYPTVVASTKILTPGRILK